jgi:hypothetical protein
MQTLSLVNPCSGGIDTNKSSLSQNPYLVDKCSGDMDSNIDQSPLSQNPYLVDECSGKIGWKDDLFLEHPNTISLSTNGFLAHAKNINKLSKKIDSAGKKGTKAMDHASRKVVGNPPDVKKHVGRGVASLMSGAAHRASSLVKRVVGAKKKNPQ